MKRDYAIETERRTAFIRELLAESGARGIVLGNSGGKDSALVGILCKRACADTVGIALPCYSRRNYEGDLRDAQALALQYGIELRIVDLTAVRESLTAALAGACSVTEAAAANIAPRLRMAALYAIAASENRLVAGTGNRSEIYTGYFTKWGDGAFDFNPIADLTVTEVLEFLRYLKAPLSIIEKAPSAGLSEGQTDEAEMGITYSALDEYILNGKAEPSVRTVIDNLHQKTHHKRRAAKCYEGSV